MLKRAALFTSLVLLGACADDPGSESWCAAKKAQPKSEWSMDDAKVFAAKCLLDSTTIGSEAWCEKMKEKDKKDFTVEEAADFAKHCVI